MKHAKVTRDQICGTRALVAGLVVATCCLVGTTGTVAHAEAAPPPVFSGSVTTVPVAPGGVPATTGPIAVGSDGNLWLGTGTAGAIIRLTPGGVATQFTTGITPGAVFGGFTKGPDGNVWFTEYNKDKVGKITPSGVVTEYPLPNDKTFPLGIVAAPDGQLWFAQGGSGGLGHITTSGVYTGLTTNAGWGYDVAVGSDNAMWSAGTWKLVRTTLAGVSTTFSTERSPGTVISGPDGNIWVLEAQILQGTKGGVQRFSTAGVSLSFTEFVPEGISPTKATIGPDGDVWFSAIKTVGDPPTQQCVIGHVNATTHATTFYDCGATGARLGLTVAPDGNLWTGGVGVATWLRFESAPKPPTGVSATSTGDAQVTLHWTAPTADPNVPTTAFHVTPYENGVAKAVRNFDASTTTRVITGLTNGKSYTFRVTASNSIGTSDPSEPSAAVIPRHTSDDEAFVRAAYEDFISRPPTAPELDTWVPFLKSGGSRTALVTQLAASPEWVSAIVTRFYTDTLGRTPDPDGLKYWNGLIISGRLSVASVASRLYASDEYYTHFGGGTPRTWVSDLYTKILRRSPATDHAGVAYWTTMVASHGRTTVAYSFYQSFESRMDRVDALYEALLHRHAETDGQTYWAGVITSAGDVALAKNLALSAEYYTRAAARFP